MTSVDAWSRTCCWRRLSTDYSVGTGAPRRASRSVMIECRMRRMDTR
jgi:hypothetical protein